MNRAPRTTARRGFTLLELLVVIFIIGMLVSLLMPAIQKMRGRAKKTESQATAATLAAAIRAYHHEYGFWPCDVASRSTGGTWSNNNNNVVIAYLQPDHAENQRHMVFWTTDGLVKDAFGSNYWIQIDVTQNCVKVGSPNVPSPGYIKR